MFKKVSLYIVERLTTIFTGLAAFVLLARFFGPNLLGELSVVQALSAALFFMVPLGLDRFIVKSLVEKNVKVGEVLITATLMRFSGWLLYSLSLFVAAWFMNPKAEFLALATLEALTNLFMHVIAVRFFYEATGQVKELVISVVISRMIGFLYLLTAIYFDSSFLITCIFFPLQSAIRLIVLFYFLLKKQKTNSKKGFNTDWVKEYMPQALPVMLAGAVFPIFMQADVLMVSYFFDEKIVGLYAAPMKIITQVGFLGSAIMTAFFPILISNYNNSREQFQSLVSTISRGLFLISICITLIIFVFSELIVDLLFGSDYVGSIGAMQALSIIILVLIPSKLYSALLTVHGLARYELPKAIIAVLLNIALNIVLIPKYSIVGAAIASFISYFFSDILFYFFLRKLSPISSVVVESIKGIIIPVKTIKDVLALKHLS